MRYTRLRASTAITDSFFPLGSWQQPRSDQWDGFARLARSGEGIIVLFRNQSDASSIQLSIPGFPDGAFAVTSWTTGSSQAVEGQTLRDHVHVIFPPGARVEVFSVHRR